MPEQTKQNRIAMVLVSSMLLIELFVVSWIFWIPGAECYVCKGTGEYESSETLSPCLSCSGGGQITRFERWQIDSMIEEIDRVFNDPRADAMRYQ